MRLTPSIGLTGIFEDSWDDGRVELGVSNFAYCSLKDSKLFVAPRQSFDAMPGMSKVHAALASELQISIPHV